MERRAFLELAGLGLCGGLVPLRPDAAAQVRSAPPVEALFGTGDATVYGSGYFGKWVTDPFGLPAYHYTCNQITDPKAVSPVDKTWRSPTDHSHQVGNDRLVAMASNYGYIQVRQDEGSPKFLNDYCPEQHQYGAGIGFLACEDRVLSTYYSNEADSFDRIFGMGYLRKRVTGHQFEVDQVIFAPFGDDPVLISQVTVTNRSNRTVRPRWVEYWGCHNYQFSWRSLMEGSVPGVLSNGAELRRKFSGRFTHKFQTVRSHAGLLETQSFAGRTTEEESLWQAVQARLKADPTTFYGGPVPPLAPRAAMDDLHPPATFLISLDGPADGFTTNAGKFFKGELNHPQGMGAPLDNDLSSSGPESAFFLERRLALDPGECRTMYFLYGYLPEGFNLDSLATKYVADAPSHWAHSSAQWKQSGLVFRTDSELWVERETAWSGYYLRSGLTYDSFFGEHILSQGAGYQYLAGLQCAARDPLQHVLPLIFTNPQTVRDVIRYTLKEMQPDGSIPYGIVGSGVLMPCIYQPSDLQLWVLWAVSEYVLATRDRSFLEEKIPAYPRREADAESPTVRELLARCYQYLTTEIGVGSHGLMRLLNGDWNDSIVWTHVAPAQVPEVSRHSESVLNSAMACYVFPYYARMLEFMGDSAMAEKARALADSQRHAVREQWTGRWFRRAWLGEKMDWVGEKQMWLEPQPWALLGGAADEEQAQTLVRSLDSLMRRPSPIGALLQNRPDPTMKDEPGTGTNGGIFAAINGTLIWALSQRHGEMAWDEWKKNTLARHAETYPDMWFGIWSGPDAYHSVLAKKPGWTQPDFPIMNMHAHAWPLYSATKLLGLEFHEGGISFQPALPLPQYEFASPLLGFKKSAGGYSGWYSPVIGGSWTVDLALDDSELSRIRCVTVNSATTVLKRTARGIHFNGESRPGVPLRWETG